MKKIATAVTAALLVTGCGASDPPLPKPLTEQQLIDRAATAVVAIKAQTGQGLSTGTGWVVGPQEIVTAAHVIAGAQDVEVRFGDGAVVPARIVGESTCGDRALLQLTRPVANMTVLPLASDARLVPNRRLNLLHYGSQAVKEPGSEELTTSPLTVANPKIGDPDLGPGFPALRNLIQLQGVAPPGASGGAILDASGRVTGMVVLGETRQSQAYALPVEQLRAGLAGLRGGDRSDSLGLGLTPVGAIDLTELFRNDLSYTTDAAWLGPAVERMIGDEDAAGLYVTAVDAGGPSAGTVGYGDMITEVNGVRVRTVADLCDAIQSAGPAAEITVRGRIVNGGSSLADVMRDWTQVVRLRG